MKILDINNFISERVKIKPITNAELEQAKKNIEKLKDLSFTKDCITCGRIIMFRDKTLGVYLNGDIAKEIADFFHLGRPYEGKYFLCVRDEINCTCTYVCLSNYDGNLHHDRNNDEVDIIRIYTDPLTIDEIKTLENNKFYPILLDFGKHRSYIERD